MALHVVYSTQRSGFEAGKQYRNPKWFDGPLGHPDKVVVVGEWPEVVAAYEAIGIPVEVVPEPINAAPVDEPDRTPGEIPPPPAAPVPVDIPSDWQSWHWTKKEQLAVALIGGEGQLTPPRGQTRAQMAQAIIETEIARRGDVGA